MDVLLASAIRRGQPIEQIYSLSISDGLSLTILRLTWQRMWQYYGQQLEEFDLAKEPLHIDPNIPLSPYYPPRAHGSGDGGMGWGFGRVLKPWSEGNPEMTWSIDIPNVSGLNWQLTNDISASLNLFLTFLKVIPAELSPEPTHPRQLLDLTLVTRSGSKGASFEAILSAEAKRWLEDPQKEKYLAAVAEAMDEAYRQMFVEPYHFHVYMEKPPYLHLVAPGRFALDVDLNAGSHPSLTSTTHNCDVSWQQLILLVGLAALCDQIPNP